MSPLDRALVRRKLATIVRNLGDLAAVTDLPLAEYRRDRFRQKGTERLLQEPLGAAIDANLHLLRTAGAPAPDDAFGSFVALGRAGVLDPALADRLAPAAGMRNRLVHEYDALDDALVLAAVRRARVDLAAYVAAVEARLSAAD